MEKKNDILTRKRKSDRINAYCQKKARKPKPKINFVWSHGDVKLLISAVEQHPAIWDLTSNEHKSFLVRDAAWQQVDALLGNKYNISECKAKWTNVKTIFQKVKNKLLDTKSEGAAWTQPRWEHWGAMQFMNCKRESTPDVSITDIMADSTVCSTKKFRKPKHKITVKWPFKDVKLLIAAIEQHPVIWDFACAEHRHFTRREAAWHRVAEVFGNTYGISDCKAKWANIKTAYDKVKKKTLAAPSSEPRLAYWADMLFMNCKSEASESEFAHSPQDFSSGSPASFSSVKSCNAEFACAPNSPFLPIECVVTETMTSTPPNDDGWQTVGDYFALQLRRVAQKSSDAAENIHRKLLKTLLESLDGFDQAETTKSSNQLS